MKDCIAYENGCCKTEEARWGFPYKCINEDYKDNENHCVEYEKRKEWEDIDHHELSPEVKEIGKEMAEIILNQIKDKL